MPHALKTFDGRCAQESRPSMRHCILSSLSLPGEDRSVGDAQGGRNWDEHKPVKLWSTLFVSGSDSRSAAALLVDFLPAAL